MSPEHLSSLLSEAEAKKGRDGWSTAPSGRLISLYVARSGVSLSVTRVEALQLDGKLVKARTSKGEHYVLALEDIYAGSVEASAQTARKAGFA